MKFKKDADGNLVLDVNGDPIAVDGQGETIPLDKVVSLGKHQRIETERDEYKSKVEELTGQIGDLQKLSGDKEALEAKFAEVTKSAETSKTEFEAKLAARDKEHVLDTTLLGAGIDIKRLKAAKALIDQEGIAVVNGKLDGLDLESFKKDNDYLFGATTTVDTGAASRGAAGVDAAEAQMRKDMGLPDKKE